MERHLHQQWRDEQAPGKYPFADGATLTARDGIVLGNDTFLDAHLYPIGSDAGLHVTRIDVFSDRVRIYIGTLGEPLLCFADFDPRDPPELLELTDTYGRAAGVLVSPPLGLALAQSWSQGSHLFDRTATEFVASVCCPQPEIGVRGLLTPEGEILTGDVWLVGENGVVVREDPELLIPGVTVIRIDMIGDPLFKRALCVADAESPAGPVPLFAAPQFLKTINGQPPDELGNFRLQVGGAAAADPILRIESATGRIVIGLIGQKTENP